MDSHKRGVINPSQFERTNTMNKKRPIYPPKPNYDHNGLDRNAPDPYLIADLQDIAENDPEGLRKLVDNFDEIQNYMDYLANRVFVPRDYELYVSPEGDDNNSGTSSDEPLKTISRATDILRLVRSKNCSVINLMQGEHVIKERIDLEQINNSVLLRGNIESNDPLEERDSCIIVVDYDENSVNTYSAIRIPKVFRTDIQCLTLRINEGTHDYLGEIIPFAQTTGSKVSNIMIEDLYCPEDLYLSYISLVGATGFRLTNSVVRSTGSGSGLIAHYASSAYLGTNFGGIDSPALTAEIPNGNAIWSIGSTVTGGGGQLAGTQKIPTRETQGGTVRIG